ncbi:MAG TPA: EamA family transporter [Anaerolineaceae bacterium]|nr:EamA family transporter [Anaerolineaceae bacterium]
MIYLLLVSLIWAFSFGLIKGNLTGVDATFVAFARLFIAALVFLPFIRFKKVKRPTALKLALTGLLQFGVMYIAYLEAFQTLKAYEVALFTIFTPIFVTLIDDAFSKRFNLLHLVVALITVAGTAVIEWESIQSPGVLSGFLLVQLSNLCYAFGQIYYRRLLAFHPELKDREVFGYLYLGAVIITAIAMLFFTPISSITLTVNQSITLLYLGLVASGLAFFLWNIGARKVNAGTLAVFNDLKIPLAVLVSLLVFGESANLSRLLIGGAIIVSALVLNEILSPKKTAKARQA